HLLERSCLWMDFENRTRRNHKASGWIEVDHEGWGSWKRRSRHDREPAMLICTLHVDSGPWTGDKLSIRRTDYVKRNAGNRKRRAFGGSQIAVSTDFELKYLVGAFYRQIEAALPKKEIA